MDGPVDDGAEGARPARRVLKWIGLTLLGLVALLAAVLAFFNTQIGKRIVAEQVAELKIGQTVTVSIGRIEGDIYGIFGPARLRDVVLTDERGQFMQIPSATLVWRPYNYFFSGIDVAKLRVEDATLLRLPETRGSGRPSTLSLTITRLEFADLTLAPGLVTRAAQRADLVGSLAITPRRKRIAARGTVSGDRVALSFDSRERDDVFALALDYVAGARGFLADLTGSDVPVTARIRGDGSWTRWNGQLAVTRAGDAIVGLALAKRQDLFLINGRVDGASLLSGIPARALGSRALLTAAVKAAPGQGKGQGQGWGAAFDLRGAGLTARGQGGVFPGPRVLRDFHLAARARDPALLGGNITLSGARLDAVANGALSDLTVAHTLVVDRATIGRTVIAGLRQQARARYTGDRLILPLNARIARIRTGSTLADPRLTNGTLQGTLVLEGDRLTSRGLRLTFPGASAQLSLDGDIRAGSYRLRGPAAVNGLRLKNVGVVNAAATLDLRLPGRGPWSLDARFRGQMPRITNGTIANLVGDRVAFSGGVGLSGNGPVDFRQVRIDAPKLTARLNGAIVAGRTTIAGTGESTQYGPFTIEGAITPAGPQAVLVFASPLPAAGLRDVRVALSPAQDGFSIETSGQSTLGAFDGLLTLALPSGEPARIGIEQFTLAQTRITGGVTLVDGGVDGTLRFANGGLDGTVTLTPQGEGQGFAVNLTARNAELGQSEIARADIAITGTLVNGRSTIEGTVEARGVRVGSLFLGSVSAQAQLVDGAGQVTATITGRRGSRFALALRADIAGRRIAVAMRGTYAGQAIALARPLVIDRLEEGGYRLRPIRITYGDGALVVGGQIGGGQDTRLSLAVSDLPLSLLDVVAADLGLGGSLSGTIDYHARPGGLPEAEVQVKVAGLTRAGLVLASRPVDLALVAQLTSEQLEARAVLSDAGAPGGRVQMLVTGLPASGSLPDRLRAGDLTAQLRYRGAAAALWRLAGVSAFDFTGPVAVAADVTGTLANPRVRGSLASDSLRVQSTISGTDMRDASIRGSFSGSRLQITRFRGTAENGGAVSGSGVVDLANLGAGRGPELDLRVAADNAKVLDANGLEATVTGPIRIVSDGVGGTIAGRLRINRASWQLGTAGDDVRLPDIATTEINRPADRAAAPRRGQPWRYLIDARAPNRVDVDGMGLNSEWSANIQLRGTTDEPRIGGEAAMVQGVYTFAGTTFDLERGRIRFDVNGPIDPQLDVSAQATQNGLDVTVQVQGSAQEPEIRFSSTPSLPEEEILARLLFGGSITSLSATDALQLGAALASLRGGGGLDPINQLRSAIGLDRLRIVNPDPTIDRGTGVALGKNISRRFYVELITDGQGYTATSLEFRITRWLSLLGSISSVGRNSVAAEARYDY